MPAALAGTPPTPRCRPREFRSAHFLPHRSYRSCPCGRDVLTDKDLTALMEALGARRLAYLPEMRPRVSRSRRTTGTKGTLPAGPPDQGQRPDGVLRRLPRRGARRVACSASKGPKPPCRTGSATVLDQNVRLFLTESCRPPAPAWLATPAFSMPTGARLLGGGADTINWVLRTRSLSCACFGRFPATGAIPTGVVCAWRGFPR